LWVNVSDAAYPFAFVSACTAWGASPAASSTSRVCAPSAGPADFTANDHPTTHGTMLGMASRSDLPQQAQCALDALGAGAAIDQARGRRPRCAAVGGVLS